MKFSLVPAWLVVGAFLFVARLAAQDVVVTDLAWLDPEAPQADVLPSFKKKPSAVYSDELKQTGQIHYAIIMQVLDDQGVRTSQRLNVSSPQVEKALAGGGAKFSPATSYGKRIATACSYSVIFNPGSASGADAPPRLERVSLVVVDKAQFPEGAKPPLTLWGTVSLDDKGAVKSVILDGAENANFQMPINAALQNWQFSPARKNGLAVPSEVRVPFLIGTAYVPKLPMVAPKVLRAEKPLYPMEMKIAGESGVVVVEFDVETDGTVANPTIARSSNPAFNRAAIVSLLSSKYSPATVNGTPVRIRTKQRIVFSCSDLGP